MPGRLGWRARYIKEVDANETTLRFYQEIYDEHGKLVEIHEKFPVDKGHRKVQDTNMTITKQTVAEKLAAYLHHEMTLPQLVRRSRSVDAVLLYYEFLAQTLVGGKWLCAVVKYSQDDAFIVTAYLTDKPKPGEDLWPTK